ncbi:MAG: hypothetical protein M1831_004624 [Alyxoria varia]|nr:MAG: hypothetical protein M1831_004624 [Alyxoria varia]
MPSSSARAASSLLYNTPTCYYAHPMISPIRVSARQSLFRPPPRAAFSRAACRGRPSASDAPLSSGRYGTANEPLPHLGGAKANESKEKEQKEADKTTTPAAENKKTQGKDKQEEGAKKTTKSEDGAAQGSAHDRNATSTSLEPTDLESSPPDHVEATPLWEPSTTADIPDPKPFSSPLPSILQMEPPPSKNSTDLVRTQSPPSTSDDPPHLEPSPHVHHFDTYSLVQSLSTAPPETAPKDSTSPFTTDQSVIIMKAVRSLLSQNVDRARYGFLSKPEFDLSTHQFGAAAAKLRTEVHQRRSAGTERMRAERTHLSHEVEILSQRLSQELLELKDELKGMMDDRKMAARMERREIENTIQELNYNITVALGSEKRNEVEGLRFVLTRMAVLVMTFLVICALATLRVSNYRKAQEEREARDRRELVQKLSSEPSGTGHGVAGGLAESARERERRDALSHEMAVRIDKEDNPGLVSLG